MKHINT